MSPDPSEAAPVAADDAPPPADDRAQDFLIVALGASAGGLQALERFFEQVPVDSGMAYVVVTHQHPSHTSMLPELLGRRARIPVVVVPVDGPLPVEPNRVHLCRPGSLLTIEDGILKCTGAQPPSARALLIDHFLRALAADQGPRAVAVILSGTGTDGTEGVRAIKHEAGLVLVQDDASAEHAGMPRSAAATGLADYVLPPEQMPARLGHHARGELPAGIDGTGLSWPDEELQRVFLLLRQGTGHDFSAYKRRTVQRRIERRIRLHQLQSLREYLVYLQAHAEELDLLFHELLIGVTSFFREPESWEALVKGPLRELLQEKVEGYLLRVWIPGCSTGEEAYSMAIALDELCQELERGQSFQIFATDVNPRAIERARAGRYPDGIVSDVPAARLRRYFQHEDDHYQIAKSLRERLVFAPQDVLKDPPFTRLDLVSCRNLLIYLESKLQRRLLPLFHYALKPDGLLVLGSSESIGSFEELFQPVDKKWKVFRRRSAGGGALPDLPLGGREHSPGEREDARAIQAPLVPAADRLLLELFAPACLLVNERGEIAYVRGRTGAWLEPAQGQASLNALNMAREGLGPELALALRLAVSDKQPVRRTGVRVRSNGDWSRVDLLVQPVGRRELRGLFLVSFHPVAEEPEPDHAPSERPRAHPLEEELQRTKENLQATVEELEASNEELKSTNEELQSANEELQSTNEELETSKEEMQSLNEELRTVNSELEGKIHELSQANDDMTNLLNSTSIATVFLDRRLNIKRFTPQAKQLIKLIESDVGRPISDLASRLEYDSLVNDAQEVMRTLVPRELEVGSQGGEWFLTRILPYRTARDRLDGVVLTFVDVTDSHMVLETVAQTSHEPLLVLDSALRVLVANQPLYELLGLDPREVKGRALTSLSGIWTDRQLRRLLEEELPRRRVLEGHEVQLPLPGGGQRSLRLNARRLEPRRGTGGRIVMTFRDMGSFEAGGSA